MSLKEKLQTTAGVVKKLQKAGIENIEDMLIQFPRDYEDLSGVVSLARAQGNKTNVIRGKILRSELVRSRNGMMLLKAQFEDDEGNQAELIWFNQAHLKTQLFTEKPLMVIGKIKLEFGKVTMLSPRFEYIIPGKSLLHAGKIIPIYMEKEGIATEWWRTKMALLRSDMDKIEDPFSSDFCKVHHIMSRSQAYKELHFPSSYDGIDRAQRRLAFEELFFLQLSVLLKKADQKKQYGGKSVPIVFSSQIMQDFVSTLPFELTEHQKIAIFQIIKDMEKDQPMLRLLQGDVGSGKTMVALATALHTIIQGQGQVAFMVPTEILAGQHYEKIVPQLETYGLRTALLVGSLSKKEKEELYLEIASGQIHLIIGTHALIQEQVTFQKLLYVIIDEQHRFGVEQRRKLAQHGYPHILHMTATPIPRTLTLTLYGDQEVSVIQQMPKGRKPIITKIVQPYQKKQMYLFIEDQILKGRQVFIVCPLIEESEQLEDVRAATREYNILSETIFPTRKVALLHGKIKAEEKDQIMLDFKNKKYDILVSTSVIEVGIDIPNASVMVIEGAERFGLSQLHQFRGRVGRGDVQSYCFLASDKEGSRSNPRLRAMEKHTDGFRLAEIDLELRGPGEVYGVRQSGIQEVVMANMLDLDLVLEAREAAQEIVEKDPGLKAHPLWKRALEEKIAGVGYGE